MENCDEEKKLLLFDIVAVPVLDSEDKRRQLEKLNLYFASGYQVVDKYTNIQDGESFVVYEVVKSAIKRDVIMPHGDASIESVYPHSSSLHKGEAVTFEEALTSHKKENLNNQSKKLDLETEYKGRKRELYIAACIANQRALDAIPLGVAHLYDLYPNSVIKRIIDDNITTKDELKNIKELSKNKFNAYSDSIMNILTEALTQVEKGVTDEMLQAKLEEWHVNAKKVQNKKKMEKNNEE